MKRLWIALGILAALFTATLYNAHYLSRLTTDLSALLTQAEAQVEDGRWETAQGLTEEARRGWDAHTMYLHILLRHGDTDDVNIGFQEVSALLSSREESAYSAANARLITQISLLYEAEQLSLRNVF